MSDLDAKTIENIKKAQTLRGIPKSQSLVKFKNIPDMIDSQTAKYRDKIFLIYYDDSKKTREAFSYEGFNSLINKTANFMVKKLGIKRHDRIGTVMHNHSDTVVIYFAAMKIGAAVCPTNVSEEDDRIAFTFNNANAKAAFVLDEYMERLKGFRKDIPGVEHIIKVGGERDDGAFDFYKEIQNMDDKFSPPDMPELDDDALIIYTSGTTGKPKGVVLTQYNLMIDPDGMCKWHRIDDTQRLMCILPIHHVNGIGVTLINPMYAGASVVLNRKFSAVNFWERAAKEKVNIVSTVPTILQYLSERNEDISKYNLSHFRHVICGAGTLSIGVASRFLDTFKIRIIHGYGLSETTCYDCFLPIDLSDEEYRMWMMDFGYPSIGCPIDVNEMAIHDPNGNPLPEGERGEIVIRGHVVMKYYYKRPDANAETFKYGWFRSGDEGFYKKGKDGRDYYFITGRIKELIIRGGINLSPFEIEEVLGGIKGVKAGLAIAFDNDWYGEEVGGYVVLEEGAKLTAEEIIKQCREKLSFEKCPKVIVFGNEIPVTSTGKFQRLKLTHLFKEWEKTHFREEKKK